MTAKSPEQDGIVAEDAGEDLTGPLASRRIRRRLAAEPPRPDDVPPGSVWQAAETAWRAAGVPWAHETPERDRTVPKERSAPRRKAARARATGSVKDAARPKAETKVEPPAEAKPATKPKPAAKPKPTAKAETAAKRKPAAKPEPAPKVEPTTKVEPASTAVPASKPASKAKPTTKAASQSEAKPKAKPAAKPEAKPAARKAPPQAKPASGRSRRKVLVAVAGIAAVAAGGAVYAVTGDSGQDAKRPAVAGAVPADALFAADPAAKTDGLAQDLSAVVSAGGTIVAAGAETPGKGRERAQFLVSGDAGRTWRLAKVQAADGSEPLLGDRPRLLAGDAGGWVALGVSATGPVVWTSADAQTWTRQAPSPAFRPGDQVLGLARTASGFVAVGASGGRGVVWTFANNAWQRNDRLNATSVTGFDRVAANGGTLVAHGTFSRVETKKKKKRTVRGEGVWRSADGGRTWTAVVLPQAQGSYGPTKALVTGPGGFYAVREGQRTTGPKKKRTTTRYGVVFASPDGRAWTPSAQLNGPAFGGVERLAGSPSGLAAVILGKGGARTVLRSGDGRAWQPAGAPGTPFVGGLAATATGVVVAGRTPGEDPYLASGGTPVDLRAVPGALRADRGVSAMDARAGRVVAVGGTNGDAAVWTSPGDDSWTRAQTPDFGGGKAGGPGQPRRHLTGVASGPSGWLAVGRVEMPKGGTAPLLASSADGASWRVTPAPRGMQTAAGAVHGGFGHVVVGMSGGRPAAWRSVDLKMWIPGFGAVKGAFDEPGWMSGVAVTSQGYAAAGGRSVQGKARPALWTSPDGVKWTAAPAPTLPPGVVAGGYFQVVANGGTVVALGWGDPAPGKPPVAFYGVSTDAGRTWQSRVLDGAATLSTASASPKGLVLAGTTPQRDAALWTSPDGLTWRRLPAVPGLGGPGDQRVTALTTRDGTLRAAAAEAGHQGERSLWWRTMVP
ncbi:hypothetical protein [Actinomadura hibisca]|uniref:hypothetical protein n=1 Tax=Actinomadura hibisca TaxID=68565 RepID=UPI00082C28EA|nr:hypothetical protein [Actinomadura hibisca]